MTQETFRESEPDAAEELREFVLGDDRDETPIFSGRADELGAVRADLEMRLRRWRAGKSAWKSATWVFQGAPGAGKSALLEHLRETLPATYKEHGLQEVRLQTADSVDDWKEALADALIPGAGADLLAQRQVSLGLSIKDIGFKRTRTGPMLTWGALQQAVRSGKIVARPVLLLIDEVQKVKGGPDTSDRNQQGEFLNALHENASNLPIFPVYGGLAHSEERIVAADGPSRFSKEHVRTLAPLSKAECGEALGKFVAEFGIRASDSTCAEWTETLASESQGWPQHLHTHLQAIGGVLLENGRNLDAVGAGERKAIGAEAKRVRDRYYGSLLLRKELLGLPCLAAAGASVVARSGRSMQVGDLGDRIQELSASARTGNLRLPPGATGKEFAEAMVRAGLLHKAPSAGAPGAPDGGTLSVPIPSMPDYLLRTYGMEARDIQVEQDSRSPNFRSR